MEIWKFEVLDGTGIVRMPAGAEILSTGVQKDSIFVWAKVNPLAKKVDRHFTVYGTGHRIENARHAKVFIGTVFIGPLVFHVFDNGEL